MLITVNNYVFFYFFYYLDKLLLIIVQVKNIQIKNILNCKSYIAYNKAKPKLATTEMVPKEVNNV